MKLYYINFFIKSLLLLILLLIINLPINNLISFCLFLFAIPVIFFSLTSENNNYFYIFFLILIYFSIETIIPSTKIHEGHNLINAIKNQLTFNFSDSYLISIFYSLKKIINDVKGYDNNNSLPSDQILDSYVWLEAGSFSSPVLDIVDNLGIDSI